MKLPTKREYASRSMASAMRSPVLEQKPERYKAAQTKFVPMPTDYNAVGNAQARAALAEGDAWAAMGNAFNKVLDVAGQINSINNTTRQKAREAELLSRISEYMSEADSRDMHVTDEKGVYVYTTEKERLQKFLRETESELEKLYKFDNAEVAENYRIRRQGIYASAFEQLDTLTDAAEDMRSIGDLATTLKGVTTIAALNAEMPMAIALLGQEGALKAFEIHANRIATDDNLNYLLGRDSDDASNNNLVRERIQNIKDDALPEYADASSSVKMEVIKTLEARLIENRGKMWDEMGNLGSPEEIRAYFEYGQSMGVFGGDYSGDVALMEAKISEWHYSQSSRAINDVKTSDLPGVIDDITGKNKLNYSQSQRAQLERQYEQRVQEESQRMAQDLVTRFELLGKQELNTAKQEFRKVKDGAPILAERLKIEEALNATDPTDEQKAIRVRLGIDPNNPSPSAIEVSKHALRSVIEGAQNAEMAAVEAGSLLSNENNTIRAASVSPKALNSARINDDKGVIVKNSGTIYEIWRDQQLVDFHGSVVGVNPHADPVPPSEEELLLTWMSETRLAPNTVVERLTQAIDVGRNPNDKDIVQVGAALVMLNSMLDAVPEMVNQEGLNSAGVQEAMELSRFLGNRTADPDLWKSFMDAKDAVQTDPLGTGAQIKSYQSEMSNWKSNSENSTSKFGEWYTAIRSSNPYLPSNMPQEMYDEMYALVGTYGATSTSAGWAYDKAFSHIMSSGLFGIENNYQLDEDGNWVLDENNPTRFKKHSIYAQHKFTPGMSTEAQRMTATGFVFPYLGINMLGGPQSQDGNELAKFNPIQVTINDIAKMTGLQPESLETTYMTSGGEEYWILTQKGAASQPITLPADHPDYKEMERLHKQDPETYPGPPYVIKIFKNSLSSGALEAQKRIENQTAYDNSQAAYEEWEQAVAIGKNTETDLPKAIGSGMQNWALRMFGGAQFDPNNIVSPNLRPDELARIDTLSNKQLEHEEGSVEYAQYENMKKLIASDLYRTMVMNAGPDSQEVKDLEAMTKKVTEDWILASQNPRMNSGSMPPIVDMRVNVITTNY